MTKDVLIRLLSPSVVNITTAFEAYDDVSEFKGRDAFEKLEKSFSKEEVDNILESNYTPLGLDILKHFDMYSVTSMGMFFIAVHHFLREVGLSQYRDKLDITIDKTLEALFTPMGECNFCDCIAAFTAHSHSEGGDL